MTRISAIPMPLPLPIPAPIPLPVTGPPIPRCPDWLRPIFQHKSKLPAGPISVHPPKPGTVFHAVTDAVKGAVNPFPPGTRELIQKTFSKAH